MKKHFSQMTTKEAEYLIHRFKSIKPNQWKFTKYSKHRSRNRDIDMTVFRSFWSNGFDLIEFHKEDNTGENRILLRTLSADSKDNQVCAVFSLDSKEIITIYNNWRHNKHSNLVIEEYDSSMDIKRLIKEVS
jgi:hypothetical protein